MLSKECLWHLYLRQPDNKKNAELYDAIRKIDIKQIKALLVLTFIDLCFAIIRKSVIRNV